VPPDVPSQGATEEEIEGRSTGKIDIMKLRYVYHSCPS
jgi:hypothetical protein